ncbi:MAG: D-aminoacyl-tRNA deacylase [Bacteroidales bacterium]|nr:D-aminoacyl-tRNA deacylase [Bacteroidales bacterium]
MRAVIQKVQKAAVSINDKVKSEIKSGLLIFIGIEEEDTHDDKEWLCKKIAQLRIFDDEKGVMNLSIQDVDGEALVISQFTLHAKTKKGNRPSYIKAAKPEMAIPFYNKFVKTLNQLINKEVQTGEFGAYMKISLINDGPVTIYIDTKNKE